MHQVGIFNPFTRSQETEADYLGLVFCSMTGYNLYEGAELWKRMREENKGKEIPQFLRILKATITVVMIAPQVVNESR